MTKPDLFKKYKLPKNLETVRLPDAPEPTRLKYEWWRDDKYYWFHIVAGNGEILIQSEGYSRKKDMMHAIGLVKSSKDAEVREI